MAIVLIQGYTMGGNATSKVELDALSVKVVELIEAESIGIFSSATAMNMPAIISGYGTALYRKPQMLKMTAYNPLGSGTPNVVQYGKTLTLSVEIDIPNSIFVEFEELDLMRLAQSNALVGRIISTISSTTRAFFDLVFLSFTWFTLAEFIVANPTYAAKRVITQDLAYVESDPRKALKVIQQLNSNILVEISGETLGINQSRLVNIIDRTSTWNSVVLSFNNSNIAAEINLSGNFYNQVGGFYVAWHPFLGQNMDPASTLASNFVDDANLPANVPASYYDFTKLQVLCFALDAIALIVQNFGVKEVMDQNTGNIRYIAKNQYGVGAIRPYLIGVVVKP